MHSRFNGKPLTKKAGGKSSGLQVSDFEPDFRRAASAL
jgi:hypothetical protein